jgi:hypothetical protein
MLLTSVGALGDSRVRMLSRGPQSRFRMLAGATQAIELARRLHCARAGEQRGAVDEAGWSKRPCEGDTERVRHRARGSVEADPLCSRHLLADNRGERGGRVVDTEAVGPDVLDRARGTRMRTVGVPNHEHRVPRPVRACPPRSGPSRAQIGSQLRLGGSPAAADVVLIAGFGPLLASPPAQADRTLRPALSPSSRSGKKPYTGKGDPMEDRNRMAAEAVVIYEELFETFKGRLSSDPKWTESRMHELMDATFDEVRGLDLPGVSTSDEVIVRASTALAQLMADAVLQTIAVYLARHDSR